MATRVLETVAEFLALHVTDINAFQECLNIKDDVQEATLRINNSLQFFVLLKKMWKPSLQNESKQLLFDACKTCNIGSDYLNFLKSKKDLKSLIPKDTSLPNLTWLCEPHLLNSWLYKIAKTFWFHFDLVVALSIHFERNHDFVVSYKKNFIREFMPERKSLCTVQFYQLLRSASIKYTWTHFWCRLCRAFSNSYLYLDLLDLATDNDFKHQLRLEY